MKILHIIPDDKFWESPIQLFSTLKVSNEYICFVDNDFVSYKYIKTQSIQPVYISDSDSICKRDDVDVFMFHSMPPMLLFEIGIFLKIPNLIQSTQSFNKVIQSLFLIIKYVFTTNDF